MTNERNSKLAKLERIAMISGITTISNLAIGCGILLYGAMSQNQDAYNAGLIYSVASIMAGAPIAIPTTTLSLILNEYCDYNERRKQSSAKPKTNSVSRTTN